MEARLGRWHEWKEEEEEEEEEEEAEVEEVGLLKCQPHKQVVTTITTTTITKEEEEEEEKAEVEEVGLLKCQPHEQVVTTTITKEEEEEEEEEAEVEEVGLLKRQPHEQVVTTTITTTIASITTSSSDIQGQEISETRDSSSFSEVEKRNITLASFDPVISSDLSSLHNVMIGSENGQEISETSSFSEGQETFEMKENPIFSDTEKKNITLPSSDIVIPRDLTPPYNGTIVSRRAGIITDNIQLVRELYLESIYQKTPTQGFYCPNCRSCIQTVLILDTVPQEPEPPAHLIDRIRCPTCFSFLIAIGSWVFPCWVGATARDPTGPMLQPEPGYAGDAGKTPARDPTSQMLQPEPGTTGDAGKTRASDATGPMLQPEPGTAGDAGKTRARDPTGLMLQPEPGTAGDAGKTRARDPRGPMLQPEPGTAGDAGKTRARDPTGLMLQPEPGTAGDAGKTRARDPRGPMLQLEPGTAGDAGKTRALDPIGPMLQPEPGYGGDAGKTRARDPTGPMLQPEPGTAGDVGKTRARDPTVPMLQPEPGTAGDAGKTQDPSYRVNIPDGSSAKPDVEQPGASTGPTGTTTSGPAVTTPVVPEPGISKTWDILKSIVYGGLIEYIASLGVVTSSASADATTLSILALSVANLIGGLFVLVHKIWDLKSEQENTNALVDRYYLSLGERDNFYLHVCIAILSFIIFGIVPPLAYGLTFYETSEKDLALVAVAGASVICITLLSIAKTYIQRPNPYLTYLKTVVYYLSTGALTSVIAYLVGVLMLKLLEKLGLSSESSLGFNLMLPEMSLIEKPRFGSY